MKIVQLVAYLTIQFLILLLMLEGGVRVASRFSNKLHILTYVSELAGDFTDATSIEDLLANSLIRRKKADGENYNSRGFFTGEYSHTKSPDSIRIVGIGDSFTYAGDIERGNTWWAASEQELQQQVNSKLEVFGLGVPGTGTSFQRRVWEFEKDLLQADLVVLAFYVGNDFRDESRTDLVSSGPEEWFLRNSYLIRIVRNSYRAPKDLWLKRLSRGESDDKITSSPKMEDLSVGARQFRFFRGTEKKRRTIIARSVEVIDQLRQDVEKTGSRFAVMIVPAAFQVYPELQHQISEQLSLPKEFPQNQLSIALRDRGILQLDLLPAFQREGQNQRLYHHTDIHWNEAGHRLAGTELAKYLNDNQLVKK